MSAADGMNYAPAGKPAPVCGPGDFVIAAAHLDHGHIYGQCNGLTEAGADIKWVFDPDPVKVDAFRTKFPGARPARSLDEILDDPQVALVAADAFAKELADGDEEPSSWQLLMAIDSVERLVDLAKEEVSGARPARRHLSAHVQAVASGEFDGGAARARRDLQETGGIEADDFLDALSEATSPGSTMDSGKLLQAARGILDQLEQESAGLMRRV